MGYNGRGANLLSGMLTSSTWDATLLPNRCRVRPPRLSKVDGSTHIAGNKPGSISLLGNSENRVSPLASDWDLSLFLAWSCLCLCFGLGDELGYTYGLHGTILGRWNR